MRNISGQGGSAGPDLCPAHKVPMIHAITGDDLCAVCVRADYVAAVRDRDAARAEADRQTELHERLRRDVSQAGTPYWRERDTMNALVIENGRLRAEAERLRGAAKLFHRYIETNWQSVDEMMGAAEAAKAALNDEFGLAAPNIDAPGQGAAQPASPARAGDAGASSPPA